MMIDWNERLGMWRKILAGWQLGSRPDDDPEAAAVRDHREATLMLQAQVNAMTTLLIRKKVFSPGELRDKVDDEANKLCLELEKRFSGFTATDSGIQIDSKLSIETTKGWKP